MNILKNKHNNEIEGLKSHVDHTHSSANEQAARLRAESSAAVLNLEEEHAHELAMLRQSNNQVQTQIKD